MKRLLRRDVERIEKFLRERFYVVVTGDAKPQGGNVWVNQVEGREWEAKVRDWTRANRPDAVENNLWEQTKGAYWLVRRTLESGCVSWDCDFGRSIDRYCGYVPAKVGA